MTKRITLVLWAVVGVVVAAVAAVSVFVVANYDGGNSAVGSVLPALPTSDRCPGRVIVYFHTDEEMTAAAEKLREDPRVMLVQTETKAEAYKRFKEIFADQPELVELARPEALPASVRVRPADGIDVRRLTDWLREDFASSAEETQALPCLPK